MCLLSIGAREPSCEGTAPVPGGRVVVNLLLVLAASAVSLLFVCVLLRALAEAEDAARRKLDGGDD